MTRQFLRSAILKIGTNGIFTKQITGLRIAFKFDKTTESTPNTGNITVYNLSQQTRQALETPGAIVALDVGYGTETTQIFVGNVAVATTKKQGPDSVTEIECGDGEKGITGTKVNRAFPPGESAKNIVDTLAQEIKKSSGGAITAIKNFATDTIKTFSNGFVASGAAKDNLDAVTSGAGLDWSVQDGELQIVKSGAATTDPAILVTPNTGLIGSPGRLKKDKATAPAAKQTRNGVEFSCLLNPKIRPGRLIKVESENITGVFRCEKVTHEGDNHAGAWQSKVECFEVKT